MSGALGKPWVTLRSTSIYNTCLARTFFSQLSEKICPCLVLAVFLFFRRTSKSVWNPATQGTGSQPSCAGWLKAFLILINTLIELCGLPSSRHLFGSEEQTLYKERLVSQNVSCKSGTTLFK